MELRDDDPEHFEFALKSMYTLAYDAASVEKVCTRGQRYQARQVRSGCLHRR
jgi:hypothetical protein